MTAVSAFSGATPRLQEDREVAALAQLRDLQLDGADARLPGALAIAVALVGALGERSPWAAPVRLSTSSVHHAVGDEGHHLPEEIVVGALLKQRLQGHSVDRHGRLRLLECRNPSQPRFGP